MPNPREENVKRSRESYKRAKFQTHESYTQRSAQPEGHHERRTLNSDFICLRFWNSFMNSLNICRKPQPKYLNINLAFQESRHDL